MSLAKSSPSPPNAKDQLAMILSMVFMEVMYTRLSKSAGKPRLAGNGYKPRSASSNLAGLVKLNGHGDKEDDRRAVR